MQYSNKTRANTFITLITFIVFQREVGINRELVWQGEGKPLSVGKVILVHCGDSLDHLSSAGQGVNNM